MPPQVRGKSSVSLASGLRRFAKLCPVGLTEDICKQSTKCQLHIRPAKGTLGASTVVHHNTPPCLLNVLTAKGYSLTVISTPPTAAMSFDTATSNSER